MTFQQSHPTQFVPVNSTRKRVKFHPTVLVNEINAQPLTPEEKSELYYTRHDMNMTMLEVNAIAHSNYPSQTTSSIGDHEKSNIYNSVIAAEADGFARGIELHIYPQRLQNKLIARRALLKYQTYLQTKRPDISLEQKAKALRAASEKLSSWSCLVALETARLDSLRAYDGDYLIPLDDQRVQLSPFPELTFKRKESFGDDRSIATDDLPRPFKKARLRATKAY